MLDHFKEYINQTFSSKEWKVDTIIQELWSGYGQIIRVEFQEPNISSAVIKHISFPEKSNHPRGWNTEFSHLRKVKSYEVEMQWYAHYAQRCTSKCRVAQVYASQSLEQDHILILEDLDAAGYPIRKSSLNLNEVKVVLKWLANFHSTFLNVPPKNLWEIGTYWHLQTRPDEWKAMADGELKDVASKIDTHLNSCQFKTWVHGDAKVANFCFSKNTKSVAAVDFQYVGAGCGMKDVVYLLGSCLTEEECELWESEVLDFYFKELTIALKEQQKKVDFEALEKEWRALFPLAWADFQRFLMGWMPGHWKINDYSQKLTQKALLSLSKV